MKEKEIKSFDEYIKVKSIEEEMITSPEIDRVASSIGLDVKKNQLANGGPLESKLLDVVKEIENQLGVELELTAGNDKYHQDKKKEAASKGKSYNSKHTTGEALDFVSKDRSIFNNNKDIRLKVEHIIANIITEGKFKFGNKNLGAINEYDHKTRYTSAGHFHLDIREGDPYIYLPLSGIKSLSDAKSKSKKINPDDTDKIDDTNIVEPKKRIRSVSKRFKIWDKDNRRILITKFKTDFKHKDGYFKVYTKRYDKIGEVTIESGKVYLSDKNGKREITEGRVGKTFLTLFNKITKNQPIKKEDVVISSTGSISHSYTGEAARNIALIEKSASDAGITNQFAVLGILSVIGKESGFIPKSEILDYSKERLPEVWDRFSKTGKRVPKGSGSSNYNELAIQYSHKPEALANLVYAGQYGNGPESSGDGYKYRGRGFNQITFKDTYRKYSNILGVDIVSNPDKLNDPVTAANAVVAFIINSLKQKGIDPNSFKNKDEAIRTITQANAGWDKDASREIAKSENISKNFKIA